MASLDKPSHGITSICVANSWLWENSELNGESLYTLRYETYLKRESLCFSTMFHTLRYVLYWWNLSARHGYTMVHWLLVAWWTLSGGVKDCDQPNTSPTYVAQNAIGCLPYLCSWKCPTMYYHEPSEARKIILAGAYHLRNLENHLGFVGLCSGLKTNRRKWSFAQQQEVLLSTLGCS